MRRGEPRDARRGEKIEKPGRMAAAKARPTIERIADEIRRVAADIGSLPITSTRDALLIELNAIADAVTDLMARVATKRTRRA
jgi:hypothetical protein